MAGDGDELATVLDLAVKQLSVGMGEDAARKLMADCLASHGVSVPSTMDHLIALSSCLMKHGGFPEVVGRSLRHLALRRGFPLGD